MAAVCVEAEKSEHVELDKDFLDRTFTRIDQSIAMGALFTAYHLGAKAIVARPIGRDRAVDVAPLHARADLRDDAARRASARWRCTAT
jgi:pyruvate kinase